MPVQVQALDARYIDGAKLVKLLREKFGEGNFAFDVCSVLKSVLWLTYWSLKACGRYVYTENP